MIKPVVAVFFFFLIISCSTVGRIDNREEVAQVLEAFLQTTGKTKEIYFKSVNKSPNFPHISRREIILEPGKMVVSSYNQNYMQKWSASMDSIKKKVELKKKDSLLEAIKQQFEIKPGTLFSSRDGEYMVAQLDGQDAVAWERYGFTSHRLSKSDKAIKISMPIFSKDHKLALVFLSSPGYEGVEVYRKQEEEWEFYFGSTLLIQ